jgi:hypothetical protein
MHTANQNNQTFKLKKQASCKLIGIVTATKKSNPRVVSSSLTWGNASASPVAQLVEQQAKNMRSRILESVFVP